MELIRSIPVKTPGNPFEDGPCRLGLRLLARNGDKKLHPSPFLGRRGFIIVERYFIPFLHESNCLYANINR